MAITKPPVLPSWAEAGDKVQPSNADIQVGWPLSSIPPSRQRFNWLLNFLANGIRYFSRRGLPDYDAAETYMTGDRIIGDDGKTYRSLIDNNIGQTPSAQPTKWEEWAPSLSRLADLLQKQTYTAFTTAGAAPNFTLTPTPAITSYTSGQRFRVKFHATGGGADVLSVSGLGNKSLKQYDSAGTKIAAVIAANQLADVEYDGVDFVLLDPMPAQRGMQTFTSSGNFTVPAGVTTLYLTATGGGGGGAAFLNGASGGSGGGSGGGGGGSCIDRSVTVTPGATYPVTVGAGGTPGNSGGQNGGAGGTTSFGALLTCTGGQGGSSAGPGGAGGTVTGGSGGIGSTGMAGELYNRNTGVVSGGQGGASLLGVGAPGAGTAAAVTSSIGYGSGGAGGAGGGGGGGSAGILIVKW